MTPKSKSDHARYLRTKQQRRRARHPINTVRLPKVIEIHDEKCASVDLINRADFERYRREYMRMPGVHIIADGLILK
jgi:hypothetical protein